MCLKIMIQFFYWRDYDEGKLNNEKSTVMVNALDADNDIAQQSI